MSGTLDNLQRLGARRKETVRFATRARRMAVLAIIGLGLVCVLAVSELLSWTLQARTELAEAERAIRKRSSSSGTQAPGPAAPSLANRVLRGASTADVQAGIQSAVKAAADASRFRIETIQLLTPQRVGDLNQLSLRVSGSIEEVMFGDFLVGLAKGAPVIGVQSVEARPQPQRAALVGGDKEPPSLAVSLVLRAYASTAGAAVGLDQQAAR